MTPSELIRQWLQERDSDRTRSLYASVFVLFIDWFERTTGQPFMLEHWTTLDTRGFRDYLLKQDKKLKASTINNRLAALASFCEWAVEHGHMPIDPTAGVKRIKQQKKPTHVLDRNESNALQRTLNTLNPQERFIVTFLLNTGLRVSEFCALELQDIWLGERHETLDTLLDHLPAKTLLGEVHVQDGKGHKQRAIHLNADGRSALLAYLAVRPRVEDSHLLISLKYKRPIGPHSVGKLLREKVGPDSHIPGLHPHLFRAETGTRLIRSGVPINVVAEILGHANIATTQRYLGVQEGEMRAAMEKISTQEE